jgi:hypothetical protein
MTRVLVLVVNWPSLPLVHDELRGTVRCYIAMLHCLDSYVSGSCVAVISRGLMEMAVSG